MVIWLNKSGFFRERTIQTTAAGCKLKVSEYISVDYERNLSVLIRVVYFVRLSTNTSLFNFEKFHVFEVLIL